jgi:hypothetical protein
MVLLRMLPPKSIQHQNNCVSSRYLFTPLGCSPVATGRGIRSCRASFSRVYFQPIPSEHQNPSYVIHR